MTKKRKLNSKNPKYKTEAQVKATTKEVDKRVLIAEAKGAKVYATFYTDTNQKQLLIDIIINQLNKPR